MPVHQSAAISEKRLSLTPNGNVRYQLKTPYRDGMTHVIFEPLDFIARLAALVPTPRVNLARFHGVFAPNSTYRARVTPGNRGRGESVGPSEGEEPTLAERRAAMTWAQRLKRVFGIETCSACGGAVRIIACIEDPAVIEKILAHLEVKGADCEANEPAAASTRATAARVVRRDGLTPRKLSLDCAASGAARAPACRLYRNDLDDQPSWPGFRPHTVFRATARFRPLTRRPSTSQNSRGSKRWFMLPILGSCDLSIRNAGCKTRDNV